MTKDSETDSHEGLQLDVSDSRSRFSSGNSSSSSGPDSPLINVQKEQIYLFRDQDKDEVVTVKVQSKKSESVVCNGNSNDNTDDVDDKCKEYKSSTETKIQVPEAESNKDNDGKETSCNNNVLPVLSSSDDDVEKEADKDQKDPEEEAGASENVPSSDDVKDDVAKKCEDVSVQKSNLVNGTSDCESTKTSSTIGKKVTDVDSSDEDDVGESASSSDDVSDITKRLSTVQLDNRRVNAVKIAVPCTGVLCSRSPDRPRHQQPSSQFLPYNIQPRVSSYHHHSGGEVQQNNIEEDVYLPPDVFDLIKQYVPDQELGSFFDEPSALAEDPNPVPPPDIRESYAMPPICNGAMNFYSMSPPTTVTQLPSEQIVYNEQISTNSVFPPSPPYSPENQQNMSHMQQSPYFAVPPSPVSDHSDSSSDLTQTQTQSIYDETFLNQLVISQSISNHGVVTYTSPSVTSNEILVQNPVPTVGLLTTNTTRNPRCPTFEQVQPSRNLPILPKPEPPELLPCDTVPCATEVLIKKAKESGKELANYWAAVSKKQVPDLLKVDEDDNSPLIQLIRDKNTKYSLIYAYVFRLSKLKRENKVDPFSDRNMMVLLYAAHRNDPIIAGYIAETLVELGLNINEQFGLKRQTVLHYLCTWGDEYQATLCQLLQVKTADGQPAFNVNMLNDDGCTPLHVAVQSHGDIKNTTFSKIVRTLLKFGADPAIRETKSGKTVLYYAVEFSKDPKLVCQILEDLNLNVARDLTSIRNFQDKSVIQMANSLRNIDRKMQIEMISVLQRFKQDWTQ